MLRRLHQCDIHTLCRQELNCETFSIISIARSSSSLSVRWGRQTRAGLWNDDEIVWMRCVEQEQCGRDEDLLRFFLWNCKFSCIHAGACWNVGILCCVIATSHIFNFDNASASQWLENPFTTAIVWWTVFVALLLMLSFEFVSRHWQQFHREKFPLFIRSGESSWELSIRKCQAPVDHACRIKNSSLFCCCFCHETSSSVVVLSVHFSLPPKKITWCILQS